MSKRNITFTKPPEPLFIKKMKDSIGYEEAPTVETKLQMSVVDDTDDVEREDEKPLIVALKPGDLTEDEVKNEEEKADVKKRIMFSKPIKKECDEKYSLDFSSKKKKDLERKIDIEKEKTKKVKNSSLLSFEEEDN